MSSTQAPDTKLEEAAGPSEGPKPEVGGKKKLPQLGALEEDDEFEEVSLYCTHPLHPLISYYDFPATGNLQGCSIIRPDAV